MKALLSMAAFFCFAVMFGFALVATKWNERFEYESIEDDDIR
jgi:hypothetical protein